MNNAIRLRSPDTFLVKATLLVVSTLTVMAGATTIEPSLPAMRQHFADVANADYLVRLVLTVPALFLAIAFGLMGIGYLFISFSRSYELVLVSLAIAD
ncbi:hypothetical protein [Chroogloeocystis siderophila]|nr:hypothetical protein [Chroogloeocystis siderophila]